MGKSYDIPITVQCGLLLCGVSHLHHDGATFIAGIGWIDDADLDFNGRD